MPFATDGRVDVLHCALCGAVHRDHLAWERAGHIEYRCPNRGRVAVFTGDPDAGGGDPGEGGVRSPIRPRRPVAPAAAAVALPRPESETVGVHREA